MEQVSKWRGRLGGLAVLGLAAIAALAVISIESKAGASSTSKFPRFSAELSRTSHGIAHVQANDFRGLGYGLAYAYAQDNVCMFADTVLTVRGERSQFFGPGARATTAANGEYGATSYFMDLKNEDSDFFFKGYLDPEELKAGHAKGSQEARDYLEGYAAGYNRYLKDYAGRYPTACNGASWVRPISAADMHLVLAEKALHASGQVFAAEIVAGASEPGVPVAVAAARGAGSDTSFVQTRLAALSSAKLGSNAIALGKEVTANNKGMLLGNPHYPWTSTDRFYQAHLTIPGRYDAMGVILGGIPVVVIGFNKDVAWTHTVTTAVHFTTFRLALDPADPSHMTYLLDGAPTKFTPRTVTVASRQADGRITRRSKTFYFSKHGVVLIKPEAGLGWTANSVHVLADPNRNNTRLLDQWIGIGSASTVDEVKASLDQIVGLPWVNTIAADRHGNTLFADASVVPRVASDKFASDCLLAPAMLTFDGSRTVCGWGQDPGAPEGIFAPSNGPWTIRSDYVANSNDSYWLTNARALLTGAAHGGFSPLYGRTGVEQKLRTRLGFKQIEEALARSRQLQLSDLQQMAFANRVHAAELVLPQLLQACAANRDYHLEQACGVLNAWDRRADLGSRGALLFREFWNTAAAIPGKWAVPLDPADPVNTPRGLTSAATSAMLRILHDTVQRLQRLNIPLDAPLGDYQGHTSNKLRVPIHGAIGDIDGSYNSIHMASQLDTGGYHDIAWGTSYVQTVAFDDDGPVAHALLLYGQSVDPKSPWYADQLAMYSKKRWLVLPFSAARIRADPNFMAATLSE